MVGRTRLAFKVSAILDRNGEPSGAAKAGVSHGLMRLTLQRELLVGRTGRSQEPRPPRSPSLVAPSEGVGMVDPTLVDEIWGNGGLEHDLLVLGVPRAEATPRKNLRSLFRPVRMPSGIISCPVWGVLPSDGAGRLINYNCRVNPMLRVLDFVQFGGLTWMVVPSSSCGWDAC